MLGDPAIYNAFFAISKEQVADDLAHAEGNFDRIMHDIQTSRAIPRDQRTPEIEARELHLKMVRGYALRNRPNFSEAERLYLAVDPAEDFAQNAMAIPREDRREELSRQMEEIRKREGLTDDEDWYIGEGPDDYKSLVRESESLYDEIHDNVFTVVLRRYGMGDVADFFEANREGYAKLVEEGRASIHGPLR